MMAAAGCDITDEEYAAMKKSLCILDMKELTNKTFSCEKQHLAERVLPGLIRSILSYDTHDCRYFF